MNPPVNRSSESPRPSGKKTPAVSRPSTKPEIPVTEPVKTTPQSDSAASPEVSTVLRRQRPIPPPSNPRQYRAIGLIQGQYQRSEEQMTKGNLIASDGTAIDAVVLGRVISLVKNHLNLEQSHLWVVYPRIQQENDHLHVQIVGVWEPETLHQTDSSAEQSSTPSSSLESELEFTPDSQNGYFSIRGEVVYYSQEKQIAIVKIRQSPRKESEKIKFFKLKLTGILPDKPVGHFWDLQVQLQGDTLVIQSSEDIGLLPKKKLPFRGKPSRGKEETKRSPSDSRPSLPTKPTEGVKRPVQKPIIKPVKKENS